MIGIHDRIGTAARLLPVPFGTSLSEDLPERYVVQEASAARWVFDTVPAGRALLRSWSLDLAVLEETDLHTLLELAHGAHGPGPFRFMSASAQSSNVLTPAQSLLKGVTNASMDATDGYSPVAATGPAATVLAAAVSVLPGAPMTATVDVTGTATLTTTFRNAAGAVVGSASTSAPSAALRRLSVVTPAAPVTARTVDLTVSGHTAASRPQVTWTSAPVSWTVGQGATAVVLHGVSWSVRQLKAYGRGAWASGSAKIIEVG